MKVRISFLTIVLLISGVFLCRTGVLAQSASATLTGVVKDSGGEPLPGATVHLRNVDSGYTRDVVARPDGTYVVSGVIPGRYVIEASLAGFTSQVRKDVTVAVGARLTINFALDPASLNAEIKVTAEAPMIEVTKSEISSVISREMIETLPLLSRDFSDLSVVKAGVIEGISNAQPYGSGEMIVDGTSNESIGTNGLGTMLPADSIQEFRVITNLAMAEFGNMSGNVTTAITRSGTNTIQGRLSLFYRDEMFDNPNYFVNHSEYKGTKLSDYEKTPFSRTDISGFIGGPLKRDKAHFFISFERNDETPYVTITSPLVAHQTVAQKSWTNNVLAKFSYQLNPSHHFSLRLNWAPYRAENQGVGGLYTLERASTSHGKNYSAVGEWTWFPSANTMNEFRVYYSYGRSGYDVVNETYSVERPSGFFGVDPNYPQSNYEDKFQIVDNFSLFLGNHSLKAGIDFVSAPNGIYSMNLYIPGIIVFTTDEPFNPGNFNTYPYLFQYNASPNPISLDMPYKILAAFAQDSWKVTPRFTLNYGLRWNHYKLTGLKFKPGDIHNFNPRIGFSWDPSGQGKSSIRGGVGTYTANLNGMCAMPILFWSQFNLRIRVYPGYPDPNALNPFIPFKIDFPASTGDYTTSTLTSPWALQTSLGYQRELAKDISASVDLIYTRGYNLLRAENLNPVIPGTIYERRDPTKYNVWAVSCKGKSEYKGLYLTLDKRYSNGWSLNVSYTLSKSMADTDSMGGDAVQGSVTNPWSYDDNAWERNYGRTVYDARHKLTISGMVDLPLGIQLTGLFYYRSAFPWNAIYGDDTNLDSLTGDYVDWNRNSRNGFDAMWLNLRLSKFIQMSKSARLQLFAEAYNITNRMNFTTVYNVYGTPLFGKPIAASDPRLIQLGVRFDWN